MIKRTDGGWSIFEDLADEDENIAARNIEFVRTGATFFSYLLAHHEQEFERPRSQKIYDLWQRYSAEYMAHCLAAGLRFEDIGAAGYALMPEDYFSSGEAAADEQALK